MLLTNRQVYGQFYRLADGKTEIEQNRQMDEQTDLQAAGQVDEKTDICSDRYQVRLAHRQIEWTKDRNMKRQTDGQVHRLANRLTEGYLDRKMERWTIT